MSATQAYEPFGSLMPGRNYSSDSYRFGFQGMEKDDEVKGSTGTSYTTEFRMLDPRIGRWLSIDPLAQDFPWQSPYASFDNDPISLIDPNGKNAWKPIGNGQWVAEPGDGAETLARDAGIPLTQAYEIMEQQGMGTYVGKDGVTKSAVDPGDVVQLPYRQQQPDGTDPKKIARFEANIKELSIRKSAATEKLKNREHTLRIMQKQYGDSGPDPEVVG